MKSLKDQLLKAGLTDKQSVKNARKQKQKQQKKPKSQRGGPSESAQQAEQARLLKAEKDKQLNRQQQNAVEQKALLAQIKQLVDGSKIDRSEGELAFNFSWKNKIKKIYVSEEQQRQLSKNQISIVCIAGEHFELVPSVVAQKIAQRDVDYVVGNSDTQESSDSITDDDPYSDYQIPDDLMW